MRISAAATLVLVMTSTNAGAVTWGDIDEGNQYPYALLLATPIGGGLAEFCSGVLLDADHVLTAAHCVEEGTQTLVSSGIHAIVHLASFSNLPDDGSHIHPDYVNVGNGSDIAVLDLVVPITKINPATLPDQNYFAKNKRRSSHDRILKIVGYGTQGVSSYPTGGDYLFMRQIGEQILLSMDTGVSGSDYVQLSNNGGNISGGPCLGDSGGPVINEDGEVVALNSAGTTENCAGMNLSVRVDTASTQNFIDGRLSP